MTARTYTQIVETLAGQFFQVRDADLSNLDHVWNGVEVKKAKGGTFVPKATLARSWSARSAAASSPTSPPDRQTLPEAPRRLAVL